MNYFSRNNSSYWLGKKYIGIGPSAHSYNGKERSWNVANNNLYIQSIQDNKLPNEIETLSLSDCYNEYIMTGLRTIWGVSLEKIEKDFGKDYLKYLKKQSENHLRTDLLQLENNILKTTKKGKFLTDGIASDLFFVNLK
jgi:oxygen-independent coproporphyrinogen III oxidase